MHVDMDARLADMPVMASRDDQIEAPLFNLWRRARARFDAPIRLDDLGLKQMAMILTDDYWVCVDVVNHDCPVLAWVDIRGEGRDNLHMPIPCTLNYYHFAASALRAKVLDKVAAVLAERLKTSGGPDH